MYLADAGMKGLGMACFAALFPEMGGRAGTGEKRPALPFLEQAAVSGSPPRG